MQVVSLMDTLLQKIGPKMLSEEIIRQQCADPSNNVVWFQSSWHIIKLPISLQICYMCKQFRQLVKYLEHETAAWMAASMVPLQASVAHSNAASTGSIPSHSLSVSSSRSTVGSVMQLPFAAVETSSTIYPTFPSSTAPCMPLVTFTVPSTSLNGGVFIDKSATLLRGDESVCDISMVSFTGSKVYSHIY